MLPVCVLVIHRLCSAVSLAWEVHPQGLCESSCWPSGAQSEAVASQKPLLPSLPISVLFSALPVRPSTGCLSPFLHCFRVGRVAAAFIWARPGINSQLKFSSCLSSLSFPLGPGDNVSSCAGPSEVFVPNELPCGLWLPRRSKMWSAAPRASTAVLGRWAPLTSLALPLTGHLHLHEGCLPQHVWEG